MKCATYHHVGDNFQLELFLGKFSRICTKFFPPVGVEVKSEIIGLWAGGNGKEQHVQGW